MAVIEIPDLQIDVDADGQSVTLQQGQLENATIVLHWIQVKYLAQKMGLGNEALGPANVIQMLERLRDDAQELYEYLAGVPCFPPSGTETEDVVMARRLTETAHLACSLWSEG